MSIEEVLRSLSDAIRSHDRSGIAQCPAEAADVIHTLTHASFNGDMPKVITGFKRVTIMVQAPGNARINVGGEDVHVVTWNEPVVSFHHHADLHGILSGPTGESVSRVTGSIHDVVLLTFEDGSRFLVDNGIGQFMHLPYAKATWYWVRI